MYEKLSNEILEKIIPFLEPYLSQFHELDQIIPYDDMILLSGTVEKDNAAKTMIIKVCISHEHQQIYIPNIFMPSFMKHKGIGKKLISLIYEVANSRGYHVFVVDLVPNFYERLKNRGAAIIEEGEIVQIVDDTDLTSSKFA